MSTLNNACITIYIKIFTFHKHTVACIKFSDSARYVAQGYGFMHTVIKFCLPNFIYEPYARVVGNILERILAWYRNCKMKRVKICQNPL